MIEEYNICSNIPYRIQIIIVKHEQSSSESKIKSIEEEFFLIRRNCDFYFSC